jgi:toxin-antitoxin system PIN domain toxin
MRALLDVNVLIALIDRAHTHHTIVAAWFANNAGMGWASTAITQNGLVRIVSSSAYKSPKPIWQLLTALQKMISHPSHQQWSEDISIANSSIFDQTKITSPRQITDIYLLGMAVKQRGRFVTLDNSIATNAVLNFKPANLVDLLKGGLNSPGFSGDSNS